MNKEQKTAVVEELSTELKDADAIFAIDYRGISVPQAAELRSGLRDADARFRVVKNRLTLLAADKAGTAEIKDHLSGPTALTLVQGDVALAAKTIRKLGDEWELLEFKGGIMDGEPLEPDSFEAIARLPGRDQLNAQFAGIVASPLTGLVRGLGSMVQGLASQLQQIAEQGLVSGEAPRRPAAERPRRSSRRGGCAGGGSRRGGDAARTPRGSRPRALPDRPRRSPPRSRHPPARTPASRYPRRARARRKSVRPRRPPTAKAAERRPGEETSEDSDETKEDE